MKKKLSQIFKRMRADEGAMAVAFVLVFPIILGLIAILVQLALLVNGRLMVEQAAQAAARSAVTSLPEDYPDQVSRAAYMALTPLSPKADSADQDGQDMMDALGTLGVQPLPTFALRYTYAKAATKVTWTSPLGAYPSNQGQPMELTVAYKFPLIVPIARLIVADPNISEVAGITGHFVTLKSTVKVMTAHSRKASADGSGWPG